MPMSAPHWAQNGSGSWQGFSSSTASNSVLSSMASQTAGKFIASHSRPATVSSGPRAASRLIRSSWLISGVGAAGAGPRGGRAGGWRGGRRWVVLGGLLGGGGGGGWGRGWWGAPRGPPPLLAVQKRYL